MVECSPDCFEKGLKGETTETLRYLGQAELPHFNNKYHFRYNGLGDSFEMPLLSTRMTSVHSKVLLSTFVTMLIFSNKFHFEQHIYYYYAH